MKIAVVTRRFPALAEPYVARHVQAMLQTGHEVDIYAFYGDWNGLVHESIVSLNLKERTRYLQGPPHDRWRRLFGAARVLLSADFRHRRTALNLCRYGNTALSSRIYWLNCPPPDGHYDVIHCHHADSGVAASWWRVAGLVTGKIMTTFHGGDIVQHPSNYRRHGYELLFREGDAFTGVSQFTVDRAIRAGCPRDRISVWPMGLDPDNYDYHERSMPRKGPIVLLTVGRLTEQKGVHYSIRAFARVAQERPNLEYWIVGEGPDRSSLEDLIKSLGLTHCVRLLGYKTERELHGIYRDAHIFVLPSLVMPNGVEENRPVVLMEAQACGIPVISTRTGGIPETVREGKSAYLVSERDSDALAERMKYLIDHPQVWAGMAKDGREYVEGNFHIGKLNDRILEIYGSMVDRTQGHKLSEASECVAKL